MTTVSVYAEPVRRVGGGWIALFATAWLGVWMAQLAPIQYILPLQIQNLLNTDYWLDNVVAFGVISGISGVCALIAFPVTGALSDRTTSRFGRRRPWIFGGTVLFALSLLALGAQTSLVGMGVFWSLAITGFSILTSALTATISDQVPVGQRGFVSGWISAPQAVGTIIGVVLATIIVGTTAFFAGYAAMALLLLVLALPFSFFAPDARLTRHERPAFNLSSMIAGFWISPRKHPDFGWTLLSRILVNTGNALGTGLLLYFLEFGLHMNATDAGNNLLVLIAIYMVFVILASLFLGRLSDRLGRRKAFVWIASLIQGVAALLLAFIPEFTVACIAAGLLGLGYGCFLSVDQALATQVLPDPADRGKDLGIMNIATAVPQAMAELLGAGIVVVAGFTGLFVLSAVAALLGAATVLRVKGVR